MNMASSPDCSLLDNTVLALYNQMQANPNLERITQGLHQIDHLFNRLADVSDLTRTSHSYKKSTEINKATEDDREELKDQVCDLPSRPALITNPFT